MLRALRTEAGLSMRATGGLVGISSSTIAHIETGRMNPPKGDTVESLLHAYGGIKPKSYYEKVRKFQAKQTQRDECKTTDSDHPHEHAPNLLPGRKITDINQVWVTDLTYIRIATGFVYLAIMLGLYSRRVVGWAISDRIDAALCLAALDDAIEKRRPRAGLIHHSDRGVQYACREYRQRMLDHEITASMSAQGYCYDNAFMESWSKVISRSTPQIMRLEERDEVL